MTGKLVFAHLRCSEFRRRNARKFCGTLHWTPTNTVVTHSISFPEEKLEHVLWLASFNPNIVRPSLWMSANDKAKKSPSWMLSSLAGLEFGFTNFQMISQMHVFFLLPDGYLRGKHVLYREPAWTYNGEPQNTSTFHFVRPNSIHRTEHFPSKYFGGFDQRSQCLSSHVC